MSVKSYFFQFHKRLSTHRIILSFNFPNKRVSQPRSITADRQRENIPKPQPPLEKNHTRTDNIYYLLSFTEKDSTNIAAAAASAKSRVQRTLNIYFF